MPRAPLERFGSFLSELKRRRVFRVAAVYAVIALATLQAADVLTPALRLPEWTMTLLVLVAAAGFIGALGLAWAFDVVPDAGRRKAEADGTAAAQAGPPHSAEPAGGAAATVAAGSANAPVMPAAGSANAPIMGAPGPAGSPASAAVMPAEGPAWSPASAPVAPAAGPVWSPVPAGDGTPRVAVMPFLNLSPDPDNEYFADGVTEDVIAGLSKIRALRVISRTSVMPFKQRSQSLQKIAATLGATTVVDGSVRREGDRVRIVAQLIDVASDRHLWAETYDRQLNDIFRVQSDVALSIAAAMRAELSLDETTRIRHEPTDSREAHELYLKGRHQLIRFTPDSLERAIRFFEQALEVDPGFALAHASIAIAFAEMSDGGMIAAEIARPRATAAVAAALRLDPLLSEAHTAAGYIKSLWEFDWPGAEAAFRRALELSPSNADAYDFYGRLYRATDRHDEALALMRRAQQLDPIAHRTDVANALIRAGRYDEAVSEAARAVEFDAEHDRARATLGWAYLKQGRTREGLAELERAVALSPDNVQWLAQLGQARALTGDEPGAREVLRQLEARARDGFVSPYHLAFVHTGLGEHERALDLLERAAAEGTGAIHGIRGSFLLAPLRAHPRFQALVGRLNTR